jgi:hypothetical protein
MKKKTKPIEPLYIYKDNKKQDKTTADVFLTIEDYERLMKKLKTLSREMKQITMRRKKERSTAKCKKV